MMMHYDDLKSNPCIINFYCTTQMVQSCPSVRLSVSVCLYRGTGRVEFAHLELHSN